LLAYGGQPHLLMDERKLCKKLPKAYCSKFEGLHANYNERLASPFEFEITYHDEP